VPGENGHDWDVNATEALAVARRLADEVLFPAAMRTDAADLLPDANLDLLAEAGLYGIAGPADAGGSALEAADAARVVEVLASGCLTTAFVWTQHHGPVRAIADADNTDLRDRWLAPMCAGLARAGVALGGLLGASSLLRARPTEDGWVLDGESPWVTGWGRVDVLYVAARDGEDVVWTLVDAEPSGTLTAEPLRLVAVNASGTVTLRFDGHAVPADRVIAIEPYTDVLARDAARLRVNGSLALGVAGRCCALLGPGPLDAELAAVRAALDTAGPHAAMPAARAAASELAVRAAAALIAGREPKTSTPSGWPASRCSCSSSAPGRRSGRRCSAGSAPTVPRPRSPPACTESPLGTARAEPLAAAGTDAPLAAGLQPVPTRRHPGAEPLGAARTPTPPSAGSARRTAPRAAGSARTRPGCSPRRTTAAAPPPGAAAAPPPR